AGSRRRARSPRVDRARAADGAADPRCRRRQAPERRRGERSERRRPERTPLCPTAGLRDQAVQRGCGSRRPPASRSARASPSRDRACAAGLRRAGSCRGRRAPRVLPAGARPDARGRRSLAAGKRLMHSLFVVLLAASSWQQAPATAPVAPEPPPQLQPTIHAALPKNVDDYWFAPRAAERAGRRDTALTDAAAAYSAGNFAGALTSAHRALAAGGPLETYAQYYVGMSNLRLSNAVEADKAFDAVLAQNPDGYLSVPALIGKAEGAEGGGDFAGAAEIYERLPTHKSVAPEEVLSRLGRAALAAGNRQRAAEALLRVYYEFPLSDAAQTAGSTLASLQDVVVRKDAKLDLGRAQILFGAKRYSEARSAFQDIQRQTSGDDRELVDLRIAECDYFLKRYAYARDGVQPYLDQASRKAEAKFFYLSALQGLGDAD